LTTTPSLRAVRGPKCLWETLSSGELKATVMILVTALVMASSMAVAHASAPEPANPSLPTESGALPVPLPLEAADYVLVRKGERRLYLLREGRVLRSYPVRLGLNPEGHKLQEGDFRTPEGVYSVAARNPRSEFFLSLKVSYPSPEDRDSARRRGVPPGGEIMIHGLPNVPRKPLSYYRDIDWTNGCIAVNNDDMLEIWLLTRNRIPVEIRP
jgi:murein L,D-transpeptidase YafK